MLLISFCRWSDKPWITGKIKSLIAKRQKLLKFGKDSPAYKEARNAVQKQCENCKKCFYDRKVAKLKQTNVRRWWKEIKGLTGLRCSENWVQQMLGDQLESTELLANSFNTFLAGLTADFVALPQIIPSSFFPIPEHLLVDTHMVYKALRGIKSNRSGGPDPIQGKVWKEFAFELSPVITNIYNASMVQGYVLVFLKQSEVVPVPQVSPPKSSAIVIRFATMHPSHTIQNIWRTRVFHCSTSVMEHYPRIYQKCGQCYNI